MKFANIEIDDQTINTLIPNNLHKAKNAAMDEFKFNKKCALWMGGFALLMSTAAFITKKEVPMALALLSTGITTVAVKDGKRKLEEAKEIDVVTYIKTGNINHVDYPDSVYKAKKSGLTIG